LFAASSYRCSYRVTTIRRNLVGSEPSIAWTDLDKFFCGIAAFEGVLFCGLAVHFGTTISAIAWSIPPALAIGAWFGRSLAVDHLSNYRLAVDTANRKSAQQIRYAQEQFPSQSEGDISYVASVGQAALIARNIAVDKAAVQWLRK